MLVIENGMGKRLSANWGAGALRIVGRPGTQGVERRGERYQEVVGHMPAIVVWRRCMHTRRTEKIIPHWSLAAC